jgi:hypothetical protein
MKPFSIALVRNSCILYRGVIFKTQTRRDFLMKKSAILLTLLLCTPAFAAEPERKEPEKKNDKDIVVQHLLYRGNNTTRIIVKLYAPGAANLTRVGIRDFDSQKLYHRFLIQKKNPLTGCLEFDSPPNLEMRDRYNELVEEAEKSPRKLNYEQRQAIITIKETIDHVLPEALHKDLQELRELLN